ncbi:acid protease [Polyporus arcularius HHB13444]|uniref:Acid protease n=1 Tax=Polyporus arcularius HHB13444 TaxID=1314778 RepID=A0A5C3PNM7_9APHY|nr:acid protease [Polyporus arcularius HHB13444]
MGTSLIRAWATFSTRWYFSWVGGTLVPLIIDTGSADLWTVSDGCHQCSAHDVALYPQRSLSPVGQDVDLLYGDSRTGTHASGPIGTDTVGVAGLSIPDQCFAAIVDTNTSVLETGSSGILGLGFPPISVIWRQLLALDLNGPVPTHTKRDVRLGPERRTDAFPSFEFLNSTSSSRKRQDGSTPYTSAIDSFSTIGPLFTRLAALNILSRPLVVTALQRDTVSLGGNAGTLSLGAFPYDLTDDDLTWVPVRGYRASEGGLPPSPQAPNEVYPLVWEIPVDDVYFDGVKLPRSALSPRSISLSALVDTGNSLIRGPQDIVGHIYALIGDSFDCSIPHNLSFQIGGVQFPVDPRDFAQPAAVRPGTVYPNEVARCSPALAATDPPGAGGFMYSWSLGDPFLKSALVAFSYGNMTHPSQDPPRVGLLSTVPSDAGTALEKAVASAVYHGGVFPSTSEPAPYATPIEMHTLDGIPPPMTQGPQWAYSSGAARAGASVLGVLYH